MTSTTAPLAAVPDHETPSPALEARRLLELTLQKKRIDRLIDLGRARLDQAARSLYEASRPKPWEAGAAPTWKIKGLGQVRLDGCDAEPRPLVRDADAYDAWVQKRFPSETSATIRLAGAQLEAALEALDFAGIDVVESTRTVVSNHGDRVLASVTLIDLLDPENPDPGLDPRWVAVDDDGEVIPGVIGKVTASPRLVVAADRAAAAEISAEADYEHGHDFPDSAPSATDQVDPAPEGTTP